MATKKTKPKTKPKTKKQTDAPKKISRKESRAQMEGFLEKRCHAPHNKLKESLKEWETMESAEATVSSPLAIEDTAYEPQAEEAAPAVAYKKQAPPKERKRKTKPGDEVPGAGQQFCSSVSDVALGTLGFVGDVGKGSVKLVSTVVGGVIGGTFNAVGWVFLGAVKVAGMGCRGVASIPASLVGKKASENRVKSDLSDEESVETFDDGEPLGAPFDNYEGDEGEEDDLAELSRREKMHALMDSILSKQKTEDTEFEG